VLFKTLKEFYSEYEMPLARCFTNIDMRGVLVDQKRLEKFIKGLDTKLQESTDKISTILKRPVIAKGRKGVKTPDGTLNVSSPLGLKKVLIDELGIKLKVDWKSKNQSTGEEALNEAYAKTGHPILKEILIIRELTKLKGTYAEATLLDSTLYSSYSVAGTVSGRRSNRATIFTSESGHAIGTNTQNLPKQSELGKDFRECLVARPGKIFVSCDQAQAEDWVVSAIITDQGGGDFGLQELRQGIDRHERLASQIFNKPPSECYKGSMLRFMGKKTRHAGNYGEGPGMMAVTLIKEVPNLVEQMSREGKLVPYCTLLLNGFHAYEPEIRNSFQRYVEDRIRKFRTLTTPVGRERYFFGLRPDADNSKIFKEAFSYIPQSTVGDNTGLAVLHCERVSEGLVNMETHDSITLEVWDDEDSIFKAVEILRDAFDRTFTFPNGTQIKIPIKYTFGYDLKNEVELDPQKCQGNLETGLRAILPILHQHRSPHSPISTGPQPQL
jgi:DNA polymerase I